MPATGAAAVIKIVIPLLLVGLVTPGNTAPKKEAAPATSAQKTSPPRKPKPPPPRIDLAKLKQLQQQALEHPNIGTRVAFLSRAFINTPYGFSPLGEASPPDKDPRFRHDLFDCTTFVETMVALSLGQNLQQSQQILDAIRYQRGQVSFVTRKHFPMSQWVPMNIEDGFFVDITRQVGGQDTTVATKVLNQQVWQRRRDKFLSELAPEQIPNGTFSLPIIPIHKAVDKVDRIPDGTIITIVREDFRSIPIRVSHQGLLVKKRGKMYMRHAISKGLDRVVDEELRGYLTRIGRYGKWPVTGIHLLQPQMPQNLEQLIRR